jgi:hypothetical protein
MERVELPAIVTAGGYDLNHCLAKLCQEVEAGAAVHLMSEQTGRHRGWITAEKPPGCEPERITVAQFQRTMGCRLDDLRFGIVYELWHGTRRRVLGYLSWTPPECLAVLDVSLQYTYKGKSGRRIFRDIRPLAVQAEPVPRLRGALAHA